MDFEDKEEGELSEDDDSDESGSDASEDDGGEAIIEQALMEMTPKRKQSLMKRVSSR